MTPDDPVVLVASAERARREMGWPPTRTLEEIVSSAWDGRLRPADLTL
jgi:UDP-glucose 4-epimerase